MRPRRSLQRLQSFLALGALTCPLFATSAQAVTLLSESFTGAAGTQPTGFVAFAAAGMNSINDGAGEYEQRRVSANGVSIANYQVLNDIDQGAWRDTTAGVVTRYSGSGSVNLNGIIVRARNITSTTTGDLYHARLNGNNIELFRANNGVFTSLGSVAVAGGLGTTKDRLLEVTTTNVADVGTDNVQINVRLYDGATNATTVVGSLDFLDTAANAITSAGGVGFRSNNTSGSSTRATFDDLLVTSNNDTLLFYDDYASGAALRMQTFGASGSVSAQKFTFSHGTSPQTSLGLVDFDTVTPTWDNVQATAVLRLNTNGIGSSALATGLVLRETDVDSNASNGPGDLYHYRLNRDEANNTFTAQLMRKDGAAGFDFLQTVSITDAQIPESADIFLSFSAVNEGTVVHLIGMASLSADFSNPFGVIDFLDNSPNAILTGGSAGFRMTGVGTSNFDNFTLTQLPEGVAFIPEPSVAILSLMGMAGLGLRRRRAH